MDIIADGVDVSNDLALAVSEKTERDPKDCCRFGIMHFGKSYDVEGFMIRIDVYSKLFAKRSGLAVEQIVNYILSANLKAYPEFFGDPLYRLDEMIVPIP